ncbi:hypothetical protein IHE45_04G076300 [Dioscorea alata]|uniref:Uncharacterized protein n=1 Tax=Dioscorea alata TaxID=55571 RepID=A0ACB7WE77_DIOAL|nr:hypothetical protein IHE45_04G076300 [Dioscorea alata]
MAAKGGSDWWSKTMNKAYHWPFKLFFSAAPWRSINIQFSIFDDVLFHVLYFFEAVVLVAAVCVFFCCCGCHF